MAKRKVEHAHFGIGGLICAVGIYTSYAIYGLCQEHLSVTLFDGEHFRETLFMLFVQCIFNALIAFIGGLLMKDSAAHGTPPAYRWAQAAFSYIAAMFCSNLSLQYIDYPTQALGKSCKPVAVMVVASLVFGRHYAWSKYVAVGLVTLGISVFMLERVHGAVSDQLDPATVVLGRSLIGGSLFFDGFTAMLQDHLVHDFRPASTTLMLRTNAWAAAYLAVAMLITGQGARGLQFCLAHPGVLGPLLAFSAASAIGQLFIYYTVRHYGALMCTIVTTTRKLFTILLSVFRFGHTLSSSQWTSVAVVFFGLSLDYFFSWRAKSAAAAAAKKTKTH